ncbi:transposase [Streptomyces verrucosisporus]|uniref:IS701 family transposase n=1 Tax=Streptomyces verrucosisporus TaxID=1695161 RepID=UPI0019D0E88F|nr:transposase [Streptomyces verrucosisporus]MBN3932815.1 transposase [Streptomyces verrucosisporus]
MTTHALTDTRGPVPAFADSIFERLPRADQRRWARAYLQGLLATPGKKSVRRIAAALSESPTVSQSLHQFVNASPWDWAPPREELVRWVEHRTRPQAWTVDLAVLRKRGEHSCGVHRRFVPSTGRSATCQVGVGAFLAVPDGAFPVDWRLLLPGPWARDPQRRRRARIPDGVHDQPVERHVLDLVDILASVSRAVPVPVVADLSASPDAVDLVRGLTLRDRHFVVAVPDDFKVVLGRHLKVQQRGGSGVRGMLIAARSPFQFETGGLFQTETVPAEPGHRRGTTVMTSLVHLPTALVSDSQPPRTYQLFAVRTAGDRRPPRLWLTSLTRARADERLALVRTLSRTAESVRRMEKDFGLLDFEGRSYPGWHHHMTLVSAAYAYSRLDGSGIAARPLPTAA